jgi:hypothetical protein
MSNIPRAINERQIRVMLIRELFTILTDDSLSDYSIAQHLIHILRTKQCHKDNYEWTENDLLISVQSYKQELLRELIIDPIAIQVT